MAQTLAPFGLKPVFDPTGQNRAMPFSIATSDTNAIYKGTPVTLAATGFVGRATTAQDFLGVFVGCEYIDPTGKPTVSNYWPGTTGCTNITAWVVGADDPLAVFEIAGDGTNASGFAQTCIGDQADFSAQTNYTVADGSTSTGVSAMALGALKGTGVQGQLRIVGFGKYADGNGPYDATNNPYPILQVQIARHQFVAVKTAI